MLVIHRSWQQQLTGYDDASITVADVAALDDLLAEIHTQAVADGYPHAVTIYPATATRTAGTSKTTGGSI